MSFKFKTVILAPSLALACAFSSSTSLKAAVIASWDWNTPSTLTNQYTTAQAPGFTDANVTVSNLGFGPGFNGSNYGGSGELNSLAGNINGPTSADLAAAITNNQYWTFTINVQSGYELDLSNATIAGGRRMFNEGGSGSSYFMSSPTGFADGDQLGSGANGYLWSGFFGQGTALSPYSVSLTGVSSLQNLTFTSGTTEFRVYMPMDAFVRNGIQQVILEGTVTSAIPEPSAYAALAGLSAVGLVAFRRRRRA